MCPHTNTVLARARHQPTHRQHQPGPTPTYREPSTLARSTLNRRTDSSQATPAQQNCRQNVNKWPFSFFLDVASLCTRRRAVPSLHDAQDDSPLDGVPGVSVTRPSRPFIQSPASLCRPWISTTSPTCSSAKNGGASWSPPTPSPGRVPASPLPVVVVEKVAAVVPPPVLGRFRFPARIANGLSAPYLTVKFQKGTTQAVC